VSSYSRSRRSSLLGFSGCHTEFRRTICGTFEDIYLSRNTPTCLDCCHFMRLLQTFSLRRGGIMEQHFRGTDKSFLL
jgi:hypothetical protein